MERESTVPSIFGNSSLKVLENDSVENVICEIQGLENGRKSQFHQALTSNLQSTINFSFFSEFYLYILSQTSLEMLQFYAAWRYKNLITRALSTFRMYILDPKVRGDEKINENERKIYLQVFNIVEENQFWLRFSSDYNIKLILRKDRI